MFAVAVSIVFVSGMFWLTYSALSSLHNTRSNWLRRSK